MKKLAATLLALAPAAPAVACDHPPVALAAGYAAQACACHDTDAFAATSVQTYSAPVVTLAPVVQSYRSATVAIPTVTHSYSSSFGASSGYGSSSFGASSGYGAFSLAQLRARRQADHAIAQARFGNHSLAAVAGRRDAAAFERGFSAGRQAGRQAARRPARRPGILGRIFGR